jgi:hypothetical protein
MLRWVRLGYVKLGLRSSPLRIQMYLPECEGQFGRNH